MNHETTFCIPIAANILHHIRRIGSSLPDRGRLQRIPRCNLLHEFGYGSYIVQGKELVTH